MKLFSLLLLAVTALFASGCASRTSFAPPQANLGSIKRIWVERQFNDDKHIAERISAELARRGIESEYGPLTMMPEKEVHYLTYADRWSWDFKTYLIEIRLSIHTAKNDKQIASSSYYQPGPITKGPEKMVSKVLDPLFPASGKAK